MDPASRSRGEPDSAAPRGLGELIAAYRHRLRQVHNGEPWTQEDLAVAIGTDKSHISRIERSRQKPARETLLRLAQALRLSIEEEQELLLLAGYAPEPRAPTAEEADQLVSRTRHLVDGLPYPAVIFDVLGRLWHYNPLGAAFYSSAIGVTPEEWHALYRGRSGVELWFEGPLTEQFQRLFPEEHIRWLLARKRRLASLWEITPQHQELIERLSHYPRFAALWAESERLQYEVGYVDRVFTTVRHPELGELFLEIQWQRLLNDPRFLASHHRPADEATAAAFARFAPGPRLSPGEPEIRPPGWPAPAAT